jgi:hypothetical protein
MDSSAAATAMHVGKVVLDEYEQLWLVPHLCQCLQQSGWGHKQH